MKIGIPRALSYYNFYPFWLGFFSSLGIEICLSDYTTKDTLSKGASLVVTETCLPVKVYVGHILNLIDTLQNKIYNCSKLRGLPDLIRNVIKQNITIIDATLDLSDDKKLYDFLFEIAQYFNIKDSNKIKQASKQGFQMYNNFHIMRRSGIDYKTALKYASQNRVIIPNVEKEYPINIALISHGYNIYDDLTSMKIFNKMEKLDVKVYTAENLSNEQKAEGIQALDTQLYWANELEMTGAAGHFMQNNKIDGLITITAFGCGPDSLMVEKINKNSKIYNKPILNLTIDEQTGEAGFITRIEAFVDMLFRKKRANILKNIDLSDKSVLNKHTINKFHVSKNNL
ncbi:MAG: hypothetical protein BHW64_02810 [Candidatus Melainabacteria bacterium LEY3_CP_29_8]|nr:MAG: hypothetical protein BHW64_02810 [Candidatus Melainabacteria bacterium LEY3_CP_29_8]